MPFPGPFPHIPFLSSLPYTLPRPSFTYSSFPFQSSAVQPFIGPTFSQRCVFLPRDAILARYINTVSIKQVTIVKIQLTLVKCIYEEVLRVSSKLIGCAVLSLHFAMCPLRTEPTYTAATYETTAGRDLQADQTRRGHGHCSRHSRSKRCTRIRRRRTPRSFLATAGRCRGHTC